MVLTLSQLFGGFQVRPRVEERAISYMDEIMSGEELAMFVPQGLMPQVVSEQPISPIPAHICLGGSEETVAMKLRQRGYLTLS
jgi:hypothetical protein